MAMKKYAPGSKRLLGPKKFLLEQQYRERLWQDKPVPQGVQVKFGKPKKSSLERLKVWFQPDGTVLLPRYSGLETKISMVGFSQAKNVPDAVRLMYHQIESVKSRIGQSKMIFDEVSRLHYDLEHSWKNFNAQQKKSFSQYFAGILGQLAKNPALLVDENKIQACERFVVATEFLKRGNNPAASATIAGIKNNMKNWLRKLQQQLPRLKRRQALVVDQKFEREKRIWGSVDSISRVFAELARPKTKALQDSAAQRLELASSMLFATGWAAFKQPAIIVSKAAALAKNGNFAKAREYLKGANKKIVLAASPISSIYPENLKTIMKSTDAKFKKEVLLNQTVLFHDMMQLWWNPKNRQKSALILESINILSAIANGINRKDAAQLISSARKDLENNNIVSFADYFSRAAVSLEPKLAKKLL